MLWFANGIGFKEKKKFSANSIRKSIWERICCMCHKSINNGLIMLVFFSFSSCLSVSLSQMFKRLLVWGAVEDFSVCVLCTVKAEAHARDIKQLWNSGESHWLSVCRVGWAPNIMLSVDRCQVLARQMQNLYLKNILNNKSLDVQFAWIFFL